MDLKTLEKFPYFTGKMLRAFLHKKHPEVTISRWKPHLIRIEKGKYTVHQNPLIYATVLITPSYCSFRSALHYYQLTNQIPIKTQVITTKQKRPVRGVVFYKSTNVFGFARVQVEGFDLFIAEKEKLLLDCLAYPQGGIQPSELTMLLQEKLDLRNIIQYLKQMNNINLIKRTGFLLQSVEKNIYLHFKRVINQNRNYPLLNPRLPRVGKVNHQWRLLINEEQ